MFAIKHAVMLAITQIGVIVVGVLAAGIAHRVWRNSGMPPPLPVMMLVDYGVLAFAVPLIWITYALLVRNRPEVSDGNKAMAFVMGFLLLIALIIFVLYAGLTPLMRVMWGFGGGGDV